MAAGVRRLLLLCLCLEGASGFGGSVRHAMSPAARHALGRPPLSHAPELARRLSQADEGLDQMYAEWERGLRRELTTRETDTPPVAWIGGAAKHLLIDE